MRSAFTLAVTLALVVGPGQVASAQSSRTASGKKSPPTPAATVHAPARVVAPPAPEESAALPAAATDTAAFADSAVADSTPHHKHGFLGKAKGVMSNKVVKTIAKTAACTMVPGGQAIAGAIDAASSKSAGEAAGGAAGAMTGSSCLPGMGGPPAGASGMGGAGLAEAGLAGAMGRGAEGGTSAEMPAAGAGGAASAMGLGGYGVMPDPTPMAQCMGLTVEEYQAMTNPTGNEARPMTKAEMKRASQVSKKVGSQRQMMCNQQIGMQQAASQMAAMQQAMAQGRGRMPAADIPSGDAMTEAPGQSPTVADDVAAELARGRTTVQGIDWIAGTAEISPAGKDAFQAAMARLGEAMKATGQRYRLDLYLDQRYDEAAAAGIAQGRLDLIRSTLAAAAGQSAVAPEAGKTRRDKNPRLEIVKVK